MTTSTPQLLTTYPSLILLESPSVLLPKDTLSISLSKKLGCFAGRSVSYLRSKQGKRRAIQAYILSESVITLYAVLTLYIAHLYLPAILLTAMLAYLIYAAIGIL